MAFEQTKPKKTVLGAYSESVVQVYFNGVTTGELDTGLKRVFGLASLEFGCSGGSNQLSVNEDFFGGSGAEPGQINGRAITITGSSGDYHTIIAKGHE